MKQFKSFEIEFMPKYYQRRMTACRSGNNEGRMRRGGELSDSRQEICNWTIDL